MFRHNTGAVIRESPLSNDRRTFKIVRFITRCKIQPYIRVKKTNLCTTYFQYISSTCTCFRCIQAHHQEVQPYVYSNWYLLFFLDDCLLSWLDWQFKQDKRQSSKKNNKYQCCVHTVVPPDDGPGYARNMQRLTKYTKNKLCIKLVFLYTMGYVYS